MPPAAVPVTPLGPVAAATLVFRENGSLRVAAIVKATFAFAHHAHLCFAQPEAIFAREAHRMNNPTRSIVATSDLVPRLPGADVLLLGQAHAPTAATTHMTVRLAVGRGEETLLDKRANVVGDRKGAEIKPFRSIPLVYEKTYGGPGFRDNPLGTGVLSGDAPPNLVDPFAPDRPIGFGPIARTWPSRTALASAEVRAALDRPVPEIPAGFDFRYFHAAPPDQRLERLVGDEWIVLEGVHPEHAQLHLVLPGAMAMVRVVGTEADGRIFSLRGDTLRIDADAERVTVVWRNSFPVREADLASVQLLAGVALPDQPIAWPQHVEAPARQSTPPPARAAIHAAAMGAGGTVVIEDAPALAATFSGTMEVADDDMEIVEDDDDEPDFSKTTVLAATVPPVTAPLPIFPAAAVPAAASAPVPVAPPPVMAPVMAPPAAPAIRARPARDLKEATLDLTDNLEAISRSVMPFQGGAEPHRPPEAPPSSPIGAPWEANRPSAVLQDEDSTLEVGDSPFAGTLASPDSAPTHIRPLAPLAPSVHVEAPAPVVAPAPPAFVEPPEPVVLSPPAAAAPVATPAPAPAATPAPAPEAAPAPAPAVTPAPAAVTPAPARSEPAADPWGQSLREQAAPAPAPKPQAPRPSESGPGLQGALYKRFKK
jgi:hypothetical protein